jgi:hypothetical protein
MYLLEKVQYMLCTISRPQCKKAVVGVPQGAAPADCNKPGIPFLGEYHFSNFLFIQLMLV